MAAVTARHCTHECYIWSNTQLVPGKGLGCLMHRRLFPPLPSHDSPCEGALELVPGKFVDGGTRLNWQGYMESLPRVKLPDTLKCTTSWCRVGKTLELLPRWCGGCRRRQAAGGGNKIDMVVKGAELCVECGRREAADRAAEDARRAAELVEGWLPACDPGPAPTTRAPPATSTVCPQCGDTVFGTFSYHVPPCYQKRNPKPK